MNQGSSDTAQPRPKASNIERYYRFHSMIYDATRWTFLFGRNTILDLVARHGQPKHILEIGCGTGRNLTALARRFPEARLTGLDLSEAMLDLARRKSAALGDRITFVQQRYDAPLSTTPQYDLVLCSYALTMFNPGWDVAIDCAAQDLIPGGLLAIVDFHDSATPAFKRWMGVNHVRMDAHIRPQVQNVTQPLEDHVRQAYGGLWQYMLYVGKKPQA
ncbi:MAG: class I SAM-dependent methyltransferase [Roseimicrobium sp.]